MRATLKRLCCEAREIVRRKFDRFARSNIPRKRAQEFRRHHTYHNPLIKTAATCPAIALHSQQDAK